MEVLFVNDQFAEEWEIYSQKQGIVKPIKDKIYSIREVVPNSVGERGLLLEQIVNKPTPRISPLTGLTGTSEQNWALSRFRTLAGDPINEEEIRDYMFKPDTTPAWTEDIIRRSNEINGN